MVQFGDRLGGRQVALEANASAPAAFAAATVSSAAILVLSLS
jgi:hypothetical protein